MIEPYELRDDLPDPSDPEFHELLIDVELEGIREKLKALWTAEQKYQSRHMELTGKRFEWFK